MDVKALLDQVSGLDDHPAAPLQAASASANGLGSDGSASQLAEASEANGSRLPARGQVGRPLGSNGPETPKWPSGAARGVGKVHYTHSAMIDQIIANPCISQNQLASYFGYTAGWVSQIISSDAFQAQLAARTGELVDPILQTSIEARFKGLVSRSLEILAEKLNGPSANIPDNLALRALELSSRALGYGARPEAKIEVNVTNHLDQLGENLVGLLKRKKMEALEDQAVDGQTSLLGVVNGASGSSAA